MEELTTQYARNLREEIAKIEELGAAGEHGSTMTSGSVNGVDTDYILVHKRLDEALITKKGLDSRALTAEVGTNRL